MPWDAGFLSRTQVLSFAGVLRAVRRMVDWPEKCYGPRRLIRMLTKAVKDLYVRKSAKTSRGWPHKKNDSPPAHLKITEATDAQRQAAQRFFATMNPS